MNSRFIALLVLAFLFAGCAGNRQSIAEKDRDISRLKAEIAALKPSAEKGRARDPLVDDLNKQLADLKQKEQAWIQEKENMTTITMPNAALFASGSIKLTEDGKKIIDEIWKVLAKYPEREVLIQGHTDNVPSAEKFQGRYKSNWELSSSGVHTELHYVMAKPGARPQRLAAVGYGEYRCVADNGTEQGRMKNRRVVIAVGPAGL